MNKFCILFLSHVESTGFFLLLSRLWDLQKLEIFLVTCHLVLDLGTKYMYLPRQREIECILHGYHTIIWVDNGRDLSQ